MKQKEVFTKIGGIIQELSDQYEYLKTLPDDLNDLELELFVSNAHFLTDHIEILCKLNLQNIKIKKPPVEKTETTYNHKYFEPVVQQMKHTAVKEGEKPVEPVFKPIEIQSKKDGNVEVQPVTLINPEPESQAGPYMHIHEEAEIIRHELILDEPQSADGDENLPDENEGSKWSKKRKNATSVPIGTLNGFDETTEVKPGDDKQEPGTPVTAAEEVLTINQKMSSQLGDKIVARTEQLSVKPIGDIKLAITLNDKLLYVKDLFNGYNLAYSEAIEILNRFNTFEEAMRFLKTNYITKNNWDSKPTTTEKFYALLKRRYA